VKAVILIRHASAGDREHWSGDDRERPLDERGWRQAEELVRSLAGYEIERIVSSPAVRCVQTVEPLARELGIEIEGTGELTEGATREQALTLVDEVRGTGVVLCTHGDVVVELLGSGLKKGEIAILAP
jgi:phosphohistidine phosphatase SixA